MLDSPPMPADTSPPPKLRLGFGAVAIAVLTWGWSNVVIKSLSTTGLVASVYRLWLAVPLLWLLPLAIPTVRKQFTPDWAARRPRGRHALRVSSSPVLHQPQDDQRRERRHHRRAATGAGFGRADRLFGEVVSTRALLCSLVAVLAPAW